MKQLIVNADDFGYTMGVNRGIVEAHRNGILTSASLMANGAAFEDAVAQAKLVPGLDIGCHLNLVEGRPLSSPANIPHLVGADGRFHTASGLALRLIAGAVPAIELERECSAQVEKLLEAGIQPSHLDTHKHTHLHPRVAAAVASTARRFSIGWVRRPFENYRIAGIHGAPLTRIMGWSLGFLAAGFERQMATYQVCLCDYFTGFQLTGRWTRHAMEATLGTLPQGVTELMCHPGYYDSDLEASPTRLKRQRQTEFEIVADPEWRAKIGVLGIVLTGFSGTSSVTARASRTPVLAAAAAGRD